MTKQERFQQKQWGQIVARTWSDPEFKARFIAEPHVVLREFGIEPAAGMEIRVVQDEPGVQHLILPACPAEDLAEVELTPGAVDTAIARIPTIVGVVDVVVADVRDPRRLRIHLTGVWL